MTQHPVLYLVDVRCSACGASFAVRSTADAISTEAVANGSRIARFNRRRALAAV